MANEFEEGEELASIERALQALEPAACRIDRDRVLYRAGQASVRRHATAWRAVAASLMIVCAAEGALLARKPSPPRTQMIQVAATKPTLAAKPVDPIEPERSGTAQAGLMTDTLALGPTDHQRLTQQLVRYGLDALPDQAWAGTLDPEPPAPGERRMIWQQLREILETGGST
jgi:hypothetical protein